MSRIKFDLSTTDHARAARLMLATLRGDPASIGVVLDEVTAAQDSGAVNALVLALADFGLTVAQAGGGDVEEQLEASLLSLLDEDTGQ